jgi:hypothetical protein
VRHAVEIGLLRWMLIMTVVRVKGLKRYQSPACAINLRPSGGNALQISSWRSSRLPMGTAKNRV